jgi:tetratricopeptide (TPR) repeat protein
MHKSSPKPDAPRGLSRPLIAALGFLILSLAVSGLIIARVFSGPPEAVPSTAAPTPVAPSPSPTASPTTPPSQETVSVSPSPEASSAPTSIPADAPLVGIAALDSGADPATGERLAEAVRATLETAALPAPAVVLPVSLPPETTSPDDISAARDAPGSALLIVWADAGDGLLSVYLFSASGPPLARVDAASPRWAMLAPESFPVYVDRDGDLALPAGLAAGALEMRAGAAEAALMRFRALQARPLDVLIDARSANQAAILFAVGGAQAGRGDLTGALQTYSQALRLRDDFPAARVNRGSIYLALGDAAAALTACDRALAAVPGHLPALYCRVMAHQAAGDLDAALADADRLVELTPGTAWSANLRGSVGYLRGDYQAALVDFEAAAAADPDASIPLFNQATALYHLEGYPQALSTYDAALALEPDNPVYHLYQGLAYQASGDPVQAERAYSWAISLDRAYLDAYIRRARLRFEVGDYDEALFDADQALALAPCEGRAYAVIGDVYLALEDFVAAEEAYTAAIECGAVDAGVYAGRGWAWQRRRYYEPAVRDYQEALRLGADDPTLLFRLGFAFYEIGRHEDALDALLGAVNGGLDTAEAHAALALALDANLRRAEAEQEFQRAIDLDSNYADLDFLAKQPLWSESAVSRALVILRRLEADS